MRVTPKWDAADTATGPQQRARCRDTDTGGEGGLAVTVYNVLPVNKRTISHHGTACGDLKGKCV